MALEKIKSSKVARCLNIGTSEAPVWARANKGIAEMSTAYNPEVITETYIGDDNASTSVDSYAPNSAITQTAFREDDVFELIDSMRRIRATGADAEVEVLDVDLYQEDTEGVYWAELNKATVQFDNRDLAGGAPISIGYTLNFTGDPVIGTCTMVEGVFTFTKA